MGAGLHFDLKGADIYWINPGDSGERPRVTWNRPDLFQAGTMELGPRQNVSVRER